ncbi:MAG: DUF1015 family protein [Eubacteriales bacterium]|nr:DUF1015 family protein [Eubacteriales bacterium]
MANIRPFRCIRPNKEVASKVAALPYDVYDRKEAKLEVEKNPQSFLAIDRAETWFADEVEISDPRVYQKAKELLSSWQDQGILVQDESECYYIYELTMNGRAQTGIVACASVDDYLDGVIAKHENTRADKELDRICHVDVTDAHTGPIFLAYRANEEILQIVEAVKKTEPLYDFVAEDGVGHRVWRVGEETVCGEAPAESTRAGELPVRGNAIARLSACFAKTPRLYIADGHHRAASAVKVGLKRRKEHPDYTGEEPFNYFLSVLFPDDELMIMPYNRVVKDLNGLSKEEFLKVVGERFEIVKCGKGGAGDRAPGQARKTGQVPGSERAQETGQAAGTGQSQTAASGPSCRHHMGMYLDGCWYELTVRPEYLSNDPVKGLDVSLLQDTLLGPVLGIQDPRTDSRIRFVGGIRGLGELERLVEQYSAAARSGAGNETGQTGESGASEAPHLAVAFAMYPTSIQELFDVADAGLLMPPKSTWFEPKLRSGLFIHKLS